MNKNKKPLKTDLKVIIALLVVLSVLAIFVYDKFKLKISSGPVKVELTGENNKIKQSDNNSPPKAKVASEPIELSRTEGKQSPIQYNKNSSNIVIYGKE